MNQPENLRPSKTTENCVQTRQKRSKNLTNLPAKSMGIYSISAGYSFWGMWTCYTAGKTRVSTTFRCFYASLRGNFVDRVHSTICIVHIKDRSGPQIAYFKRKLPKLVLPTFCPTYGELLHTGKRLCKCFLKQL